MSKSPAFQFYPSDFLADKNVQSMTDEQLGIYIKLICHCWLEGFIPNDVEELKRFATKNPEAFEENWKWVRPGFEISKKDASKLIQKRIEKERKKQKEHSKKRSEAGKKGAKRRWSKEVAEDGNCHNFAIAKNSSSSISSFSNKYTPTPEGESESFEIFWAEYPKKVGKTAAKRYFDRKNLAAKLAEILKGISNYNGSGRWKEVQYIPNPLTFLSHERWLDEVSPAAAQVAKPQEKKHGHILAWEQGLRFYHSGLERTFAASDLEPINCALKRAEGRLDGFRLPDGSWSNFTEFMIEEEIS